MTNDQLGRVATTINATTTNPDLKFITERILMVLSARKTLPVKALVKAIDEAFPEAKNTDAFTGFDDDLTNAAMLRGCALTWSGVPRGTKITHLRSPVPAAR